MKDKKKSEPKSDQLTPSAEAIVLERWMKVCSAGLRAWSPKLPERMPEIPADKMTPAQKKFAADFGGSRERVPYGPWVAHMRDPEFATLLRPLADYLRYKTVLPAKIREFIIAITSRQWTSQIGWYYHCTLALEVGLNAEIAMALNEGRRPTGMAEDEASVYDFLDELHRNYSVSDTTYNRVLAKFGEAGIIDILAVHGYYSFVAMVSQVVRTPLPKGVAPGLIVFPQ